MDKEPEINHEKKGEEDVEEKEQVVMTPKGKTANSTTIMIERRIIKDTNDKMHVAGGKHTGIIINKEAFVANGEVEPPPELSLEFRVFLVNAQSGKHTQESRILRFWFRKWPKNAVNFNEESQAATAQDFFRELVSPQEFPRDYVGFIRKMMKLMQHGYQAIKKLEVELKQLEEGVNIPSRPLSAEESSLGNVTLLTVEKVLEIIESAYPNPLTIHDIAKDNGWDEEEVAHHLSELQSRSLVKAMEHGAFTRQQSMDNHHQVTIVKQMPTMASSKQPTIAIITAQYCEKVAVDAMIENKETFVRYTTVGPTSPTDAEGNSRNCRFGESNVYTLGNIGAHRIVCTKLPSVGHTREAMTAAGNTTTRMLGTFQKVDYVFLVGVGGGVPHYTDYGKHVRLGDVVISCPNKNNYVYVYCENAKQITNEKGSIETIFEMKPYKPNNYNLQDIANQLKAAADNSSNEGTSSAPWANYLKDGLNILQATTKEPDFKPPSSDTDKLYMSIGERDLIEVAHPEPPSKAQKRKKVGFWNVHNKASRLRLGYLNKQSNYSENVKIKQEGCPRLHLSPIAAGRQVVREDRLRQQFATQVGALAYDCEFDAVIESVLGNCKDSFICIRGISDYKDGTRRKEWQPYAALAAASVMKAIICSLESPTNV